MKRFLSLHIYEVSIILVAVAIFTCTSNYFMDDSFITFVYSKNLLQFGQISYNGIFVEGYSSFLHVLIGALLLLPGETIFPIIVKVYSVFMMIAFLWFAGKIIKRISKSRLNAILGMFILATSPILLFHFQSGMETPLIYLVSLAIINELCLSSDRLVSEYLHRVFLLIFVGMLVRPEFALFGVPLLLYLFFLKTEKRKGLLSGSHWGKIGIVLLLGIAYLVFKAVHFGSIFPNPYYVKNSIAPTGGHFFIAKLREFLVLNPIIYGLFIILVFRVLRYWRWMLISGSVMIYLLPYFGTNFWQDHYFRYFSPLIPIFVVGFFSLVTRKRSGKEYFFVLITLSSVAFIFNMIVMPNMCLFTKFSGEKVQIRREIGEKLSNLESGKILISCGDAGTIPFYSGYANIDYYFLNSKKLTDNRIDSRMTYWGLNTDMLFSIDIDVFVLTSASRDSFESGYGGNRGLSFEISRNIRFKEYKRIAVLDASTQYAPFRLKIGLRNYRVRQNPYFYHIMVDQEKSDLVNEIASRFSKLRY